MKVVGDEGTRTCCTFVIVAGTGTVMADTSECDTCGFCGTPLCDVEDVVAVAMLTDPTTVDAAAAAPPAAVAAHAPAVVAV